MYYLVILLLFVFTLTNSLSKAGVMNISLEEKYRLDHVIYRWSLGTISMVVLVLTSVNLWLMLQKELQRRPSYFLYTNMLVVNLLTVIGGVCIEVEMLTRGKPSHDAASYFDIIYQVYFYSGILMLLGLGVCRVLSMKLSAVLYIEVGINVAYSFVIASWMLGIFVGVSRVTRLKSNFLLVICCVSIFVILSLLTTVINVYILIKIIQARHQLAQGIYRQAAKTAFTIFLNYAFWNTAYMIRCISFFVVVIRTGKINDDCTDRPWLFRLLLCGFVEDHRVRHVVELMFLIESLINNLILITQPESRAVLRCVWSFVRSMASVSRNYQGYQRL